MSSSKSEAKKDIPEIYSQRRPPKHIAIILDGNGRWAKRRGLPRTAGHSVGAENFRTIATYCKDIGVKFLTIYAFSSENWKRPAEEVSAIMRLFERYLIEAVETMARDKIKLKILGDVSLLSPKLRALIEETAKISAEYEGFQANVCINYGGRAEIVRAAKLYAEDLINGKASDLTEESFSRYLYTSGIPDPDLIIRPGGEIRLSNFLMWESAYSELIFSDILWPDFGVRDLDKAIEKYWSRDRRYGGLK